VDHLVTRSFSFYPPILGVEHNEWLYKKASWRRFLVVELQERRRDLDLARRYIGEVSRVDDPVLIVGLNRELEYKGGMVVPFQRRGDRMPVAVGGPQRRQKWASSSSRRRLVGIRTASAQDNGSSS